MRRQPCSTVTICKGYECLPGIGPGRDPNSHRVSLLAALSRLFDTLSFSSSNLFEPRQLLRALPFLLLAAILSNGTSTPRAVAQTRIKDVAAVHGVRGNQLVGYGLVVGLNGTGDTLRNAPFTDRSIQSMLDSMGINTKNSLARTRNVAAVIVTAELPAFASKGSRVDITVSSIGDASSLSGGSLVMTALLGADKTIYAVAQGPVVASSVAAAGRAESVVQGVPTVGRIPNGAFVERDAPGQFAENRALRLELRNPDFLTAVRMVDTINAYARRRYGSDVAEEQDLRTIRLKQPRGITSARFIAEIGELDAATDARLAW